MNRWSLIALILLLPLSLLAQSASKENRVLPLGSILRIPVRTKSTLFVENKKVLKVIDKGTSIELIAKSEGSSQANFGDGLRQYHILTPSTYKFWQDLTLSVRQMRGLTCGIENGRPILNGRLLRLQDWQKVNTLAKAHNQPYVMRAVPDPVIEQDVTGIVKTLLLSAGLNPSDKLGAFEYPRTDSKDVSEYLSRRGLVAAGPPLKSEKALPVQVKVLVAELNKEISHRLGFQTPTSYQAKVAPTAAFNQDLFLTFDALEKQGQGRSLARPVLMTNSGQSAQFLVGGEIGIRTRGFGSNGVLWKKYGIQLDIQPLVKQSNQVELKIKAELSSLDMANSIDDIPAIKTNLVSSHFDITSGKTVVLSGLIQSTEGVSNDGLAGLRRIPILGRLFESESYRNNQTELVVFVQPTILKDLQGPEKDKLPDANQLRPSKYLQ